MLVQRLLEAGVRIDGNSTEADKMPVALLASLEMDLTTFWWFLNTMEPRDVTGHGSGMWRMKSRHQEDGSEQRCLGVMLLIQGKGIREVYNFAGNCMGSVEDIRTVLHGSLSSSSNQPIWSKCKWNILSLFSSSSSLSCPSHISMTARRTMLIFLLSSRLKTASATSMFHNWDGWMGNSLALLFASTAEYAVAWRIKRQQMQRPAA